MYRSRTCLTPWARACAPQLTLMDCVELLEEEHVEGMELEEEHSGHDEARSSTTSTSGPARATPSSSAKRIAAGPGEVDPEGAEVVRHRARVLLRLAERARDAAFTEVVENGVRDNVVFGDRFPLLILRRPTGSITTRPGRMRGRGRALGGHGHLPYRQGEGGGDTVVFHTELSNEDMAGHHLQRTGAKKMLFSACPM